MTKKYLYTTEKTTYVLTIDFSLISEKRYAYLWELYQEGTLVDIE